MILQKLGLAGGLCLITEAVGHASFFLLSISKMCVRIVGTNIVKGICRCRSINHEDLLLLD